MANAVVEGNGRLSNYLNLAKNIIVGKDYL
jgi:hypothetical protein